jgi:hypothetical protein
LSLAEDAALPFIRVGGGNWFVVLA